MNEDLMVRNFEKKSEEYMSKYEEVFDVVATSPNFTNGRKFTPYDAYQLGKQIETYKAYEVWCRENASASELGTIPNIAVDIIAASYAMSQAPLLSSIQGIGEQRGLIYFKKVAAVDTRRNITAGNSFVEAKTGIVNGLDQYGSEKVENEDVGDTASGTTVYQVTLGNVPVRKNLPITISIALTAGTITATIIDGQLLSTGAFFGGAIDYTTGVIDFTLRTDPAEIIPILVSYHQDFEKSSDVPEVEMTLTTTDVEAEVLAIKTKISSLKAYQFNKRFGRVAEDEALQDLAGAMADIESRKVIAAISALATTQGGALSWSSTVPAGISDFEHRQSFKYALSNLDSAVNLAAGRGYATRYVAGHNACEYFASLPKFTRALNNIAVGPHVFGYLDGVPVIRTTSVPTSRVIGMYLNPQSPFEAPVVTATYMPMFITSTMQVGENPLQNQRAIASWKAFKGVVPQFTKELNIT
jgi:hypothetical protein